MWDMTAKEQVRKILRFLAGTAGTAGREWEDTGGEMVRGEDRQVYDPDSNSLVHTTTREIKATHPPHGIPGPLWADLPFAYLSLATKPLTSHIIEKEMNSPETKLFHIWVAWHMLAQSVIPSPCVSEKLPCTAHPEEHISLKVPPEFHPMLRPASALWASSLLWICYVDGKHCNWCPWLSVQPYCQIFLVASCLITACIPYHLLIYIIILS